MTVMKEKLKKYLLKKGGAKMATINANDYTAQQITSDLVSKYAKPEVNRKANDQMGKDEFLKLLMAQLKYQDPTQPMDNKELVSQQANFSTLEQMTNLNKSFENFLTNQSMSSQMSAVGFIGKNVTTIVPASEDGSSFVEGKVTSVKFADNQYVFTVGGSEVKMSDITSVSNSAAG